VEGVVSPLAAFPQLKAVAAHISAKIKIPRKIDVVFIFSLLL
jgi:hypothetical protein